MRAPTAVLVLCLCDSTGRQQCCDEPLGAAKPLFCANPATYSHETCTTYVLFCSSPSIPRRTLVLARCLAAAVTFDSYDSTRSPMVATLPKKDRQAPPFRAPKGGVKKNQVKGKRTARGTAPSPVVDAPIGAAIVLLVTV